MKKTLSLYLDEKTIEALKALAEREGRSVSNMVEYILRKAVRDM